MKRPIPTLALVAVLSALALAACASSTPRGAAPAIPQPVAPIVPTPEAPPTPVAVQPDAPVIPAAPTAEDLRNYVTYKVKVTGMTCPIRCVREVRELLAAVPGVLHVEVDYDRSEAVVDVKQGTDPESLVHGLTGRYAGRLVM